MSGATLTSVMMLASFGFWVDMDDHGRKVIDRPTELVLNVSSYYMACSDAKVRRNGKVDLSVNLVSDPSCTNLSDFKYPFRSFHRRPYLIYSLGLDSVEYSHEYFLTGLPHDPKYCNRYSEADHRVGKGIS